MTREEKQKAIDALKISAPIMAVTQEEFNTYIQTLNKVMDWLEQDREPLEMAIKSLEQEPKTGQWIPVSERLPELNRPLLVTTYHRVYYGHLISESGNYGYPVFRIHGLGDKNRDWVQETMSHEPYSLGRIDAWMYLDIPEPYKVEPQESGAKMEVSDGTEI